MTTLGVADFSGMLPLRDPVLLPDNYSQFCQNTWMYKGTLRGIRRGNPPVYTMLRPSTSKQVYRIPLTNELENWANSYWLEFPDPYMAVIRSPVVDDQWNRYYFFPSYKFVPDAGWSSIFSVPFYAPLANILSGGPYYVLGIPTPGVAPIVSPAAVSGTNTAESRSYVYTYVSAYGEEGPPSPPTVASGDPINAWTITVYNPTSGQETNRNLAQIRIYRTVTDSAGSAVYYEIVTLNNTTPSASITYTDSFIAADITNNLALATVLYTGPPVGLDTVVMMANGIMAGSANNREVWFSAAFLPHAWPATFELTVPFNIVAMNAIGSSLSIVTEGQPSIATGTTPDTMTIGQITANEPCISRGSVFAGGEGTYYASPNGLVLLNTSGTMNVTLFSMEREFWESLLPEQWAGARQGVSYSALVMGADINTTTTINNNGVYTTIPYNGVILDHIEKNVPCSLLRTVAPGETILNMYWDNTSGQLFAVYSDFVRWWMPPSLASGPSLYSWRWKTKKFRLPKPEQIKAFKVQFTVPSEVTITPPVFPGNTDQNQVFNPATQWLIVRVYADGVQLVVREVVTSGQILLIPGDFKATFWEFMFEGQIYMYVFKASSSVKELRKA